MADTTTLRNQVKDFASIPSTNSSFDTDIDNYVGYAIKELYPIAVAEVDADTSKTVNSDNRTIDLPTTVKEVRMLEINDGSRYYSTTDFVKHGSKIRLDSAVDAGTGVRIWGLGLYTVSTLPEHLERVVIMWALSMLYTSFAGDKRKYNLYVGTAGASANRDMKDSSQFYRQEGNDLLIDRVGLRGA